MRPEPACVNVQTLARRRRSKLEKTQRIPTKRDARPPHTATVGGIMCRGGRRLPDYSLNWPPSQKERPSYSLD